MLAKRKRVIRSDFTNVNILWTPDIIIAELDTKKLQHQNSRAIRQ